MCGIAVNITFNLLFYQRLGHGGLALGTSLGMLINFLILLITLHAQQKIFVWSDIIRSSSKIILASALLAALCAWFWPWFALLSQVPAFLRLLLFILCAGLLYLAVLMLLKTDEMDALKQKLSRLF